MRLAACALDRMVAITARLEPADPFSGTGLRTVRSSYTIEYWDHGRRLEVREPN